MIQASLDLNSGFVAISRIPASYYHLCRRLVWILASGQGYFTITHFVTSAHEGLRHRVDPAGIARRNALLPANAVEFKPTNIARGWQGICFLEGAFVYVCYQTVPLRKQPDDLARCGIMVSTYKVEHLPQLHCCTLQNTEAVH